MKKGRYMHVVILGFLWCLVAGVVHAGTLTPPGAVGNTMYTLTDIFNLSSGTTTEEGSGGIPATPGSQSSTMKTVSEAYTALVGEIENLTSAVILRGVSAFGLTGTLYPNGILKSGQTTCYNTSTPWATTTCAGSKQDGELQKGLALSYTDNGDGTVKDNTTGLTWQKGTTTTYTWVNALAYCNNNTPSLPGSGWRLPNAFELFSLVDFTVTSQAKINLTYFPSTPASGFWSATTYPIAGSGGSAMNVLFNTGSVNNVTKSSSSYVRCVRE